MTCSRSAETTALCSRRRAGCVVRLLQPCEVFTQAEDRKRKNAEARYSSGVTNVPISRIGHVASSLQHLLLCDSTSNSGRYRLQLRCVCHGALKALNEQARLIHRVLLLHAHRH